MAGTRLHGVILGTLQSHFVKVRIATSHILCFESKLSWVESGLSLSK